MESPSIGKVNSILISVDEPLEEDSVVVSDTPP